MKSTSPGIFYGFVIVGVVGFAFLCNVLVNTLLLNKLEKYASSENIVITAERFDISILGKGPSVEIKGLSLKEAQQPPLVETADVFIQLNWFGSLTGNLTPTKAIISDARIAAVESKVTNNWFGLHRLVNKLSTSGEHNPISGQYRVSNTEFTYTHIDSNKSADVTIESHILLNDTPSHSTLKIDGNIDGERAALELNGNTMSIPDVYSMNTEINLEADIKNSKIDGFIKIKPDLESEFSHIIGNMTSSGINSIEVETQHNEAVPAFDAAFEATVSPSELQLHSLNLLAQRSDVALKGYVNRSTDITTFNLEAVSDTWHSEDFPLSFMSTFTNNKTQSSPASQPLFSETEPEWHKTLDDYSGNINLRFENLYFPGSPELNIQLATDIEKGTANSSFNLVQRGGGEINAQLSYALNEAGVAEGSSFFTMKDIEINDIPFSSLVTDVIPAGSFVAQGEFWFAGKTAAEMAADLEGELYFLMESGELDALAVELMGVDLMEVVRLLYLRDLQQIDIRCAYASVSAESGLITLEHLLLDSDDTFFSAKGSIDLKKESMNLVFTPKPHDASLFTAVTPVTIKGSILEPKIRPGKRIYLKLAAAAALAALTGPAAVLVPFIGLGKGEASENCADLFSDY